jgi:hypothetical protein
MYGRWGGHGGGEPSADAATDTAFAPRGLALTDYLREPVEELGITRDQLSNPAPERRTP